MLRDQKPIILVPTMNRAKAKAFYQDVLGLSFVDEDQFALVFDSGGIMLRISEVKEFTPHEFGVLGWETEDIASAINALTAKGVKFERYDFPWMEQDELGAWTAPDGTKVAWFKDPDRNLLSLTQIAK